MLTVMSSVAGRRTGRRRLRRRRTGVGYRNPRRRGRRCGENADDAEGAAGTPESWTRVARGSRSYWRPSAATCLARAAEATEVVPPEPIGIEGATGAVSESFLESVEELGYGYCTQLLVEGEDLDVDELRDLMAAMAGSPVVIGDETMVKIHVHAEDPGPVISLAVSKGVLSDVNIANMDEQHAEFSRERTEEPAAVGIDRRGPRRRHGGGLPRSRRRSASSQAATL